MTATFTNIFQSGTALEFFKANANGFKKNGLSVYSAKEMKTLESFYAKTATKEHQTKKINGARFETLLEEIYEYKIHKDIEEDIKAGRGFRNPFLSAKVLK